MKRHALLAIVSSVLFAGAAQAQVTTTTNPSGYGYSFNDDPLTAIPEGPSGAALHQRPRSARATLIRPRTAFVMQMFKSVETL